MPSMDASRLDIAKEKKISELHYMSTEASKRKAQRKNDEKKTETNKKKPNRKE